MSVQSIFNHSGGNGEGVPPVLIPNTEVKPFSADGTWLDTAWESRSPPVTTKARRHIAARLSFFSRRSRSVTVRSPRRNRRMHKGICTYSPKRRVRSIPTKRNGVYLTSKYNRLSVLSSSGKEILDN